MRQFLHQGKPQRNGSCGAGIFRKNPGRIPVPIVSPMRRQSLPRSLPVSLSGCLGESVSHPPVQQHKGCVDLPRYILPRLGDQPSCNVAEQFRGQFSRSFGSPIFVYPFFSRGHRHCPEIKELPQSLSGMLRSLPSVVPLRHAVTERWKAWHPVRPLTVLVRRDQPERKSQMPLCRPFRCSGMWSARFQPRVCRVGN